MNLRKARLSLGLRQRDLAIQAGVSPNTLSRWERGFELPDDNTLIRLADVLGVRIQDLEQAQLSHHASATPGEGYTTAVPGGGEVVPRRCEPPRSRRSVLDLFCGAGGLSCGFEQTGEFVTTCGIDLLRDRVESFTANHEHAVGIAGDIRQFPLERLWELAGDVDLVVGGPPCQGFSSIRPFRTLTEGDPRNSLAEHYVLVIARLKPRWFVFENVVGLLTHQNGTRLDAILEGLSAIGYRVDWRVLNAALFGVPQNRERVVIVGNRTGATFQWPEPTHQYNHRSMAGTRNEVVRTTPLFHNHLPHAVTLMDAIGDLPPVAAGCKAMAYDPSMPPSTHYQRRMRSGCSELTLHRATRHSARMLEIIRHAGANISALPPGMVTSGFSSCYSRLDADRPSTTLTVNFVHPASNRCIHPFQDRALTPREGARIQSFPDRFVFRGTLAQVVKQIGNAVPPMIGKQLALAIQASERADTGAVESRPPAAKLLTSQPPADAR